MTNSPMCWSQMCTRRHSPILKPNDLLAVSLCPTPCLHPCPSGSLLFWTQEEKHNIHAVALKLRQIVSRCHASDEMAFVIWAFVNGILTDKAAHAAAQMHQIYPFWDT